jgi:hypothetical protein
MPCLITYGELSDGARGLVCTTQNFHQGIHNLSASGPSARDCAHVEINMESGRPRQAPVLLNRIDFRELAGLHFIILTASDNLTAWVVKATGQ